MRVLVTGAAGYVGRAVLRRLVDAGHDVVAMVRSTPVPAFPESVSLRTADLLEAGSVQAAVAGVDAVCHVAARTRVRESFADPLAYYKANVFGTVNLLEALAHVAEPSIRTPSVVMASTGAVYGIPDEQPISEDTPPAPTNPYGSSKLAAEQVIRWQAETGTLGGVVLRAFNVAGAVDGYADPDDSRIIPKALAVAHGTAPRLDVNGDGTAIRDFVHVDDLASAFVAALAHCEPGKCSVFNVGTGVGASVRDVIEAVEQVTGRAVPVRWGPPKPEPPILLGDVSRIGPALDWTPKRSDLLTIVSDSWQALTR